MKTFIIFAVFFIASLSLLGGGSGCSFLFPFFCSDDSDDAFNGDGEAYNYPKSNSGYYYPYGSYYGYGYYGGGYVRDSYAGNNGNYPYSGYYSVPFSQDNAYSPYLTEQAFTFFNNQPLVPQTNNNQQMFYSLLNTRNPNYYY